MRSLHWPGLRQASAAAAGMGCLILAACGGGGSPSAQPSSPKPTATRSSEPVSGAAAVAAVGAAVNALAGRREKGAEFGEQRGKILAAIEIPAQGAGRGHVAQLCVRITAYRVEQRRETLRLILPQGG